MAKMSRLTLIISTIVSLFAVSVGCVSTAAWFQISNPGKTVEENHAVTTDDTSLTIDHVNAYKTTYDDLDATTTDYSSGHVTSYNITGNTTSDNINQGKITGFDIPSEGVGYYLAGNDVWAVSTAGQDYESAWKYESAIRMDDDVLAGTNNKAMANSIYLKEGTEFKVRHHYYSSSLAKDDWIPAAINSSDPTTSDVLEVNASGNIEVKEGKTGYYNIYLLNGKYSASDNNKIHIHALGDLSLSPLSRKQSKNPLLSNGVAASGSHFFYKPGNGWGNDNAVLVINVWKNWGGQDTNRKWYKLDNVNCSSGYYHAELTANVNKLIVIRYNPEQCPSGTSGDGWPGDDGIWNKCPASGALDLQGGGESGEVCDQVWTNTSDTNFTVNTSEEELTNASSFDPGFYIIGSGTINNTTLDWATTGTIGGVKLSQKTGSNVAEQDDLVVSAGATFKIKYCGPLTPWVDRKSTEWHGYHNHDDGNDITCSDTSDIPVQNDGANIVVSNLTKLKVILNASKYVYIVLKLSTITEQYRVSHKDYTSTSPTTSYTSWTTYGEPHQIKYNTTYTPTAEPSISGATWSRSWKTEDGTAWNSNTPLLGNTNVRTEFSENERDFHVKVGFTNTAATSVVDTNGNGTYRVSNSTTISNDALVAMRNALSVTTTNYEWVGFYYSTDTSLSTAVTSISSGTLTSEKTIYAVYKPVKIIVTKYATYWIKNSDETYTSLSSTFANTSEGTEDGFKTTNFATPASLSDKYKALTTTTTLGSVSCLPGVYKFKFDAWYTTESCTKEVDETTVSSEYSPTTPTGAFNLYARMYVEPEEDNVTLYPDASSSNWWAANLDTDDTTVPSNASISAYHTASGSQFALPKVFSEGGVFKISLPNNDSNAGAKVRFIKTGETQSDAWCQTVEIATGLNDTTNEGMYSGKARGECTFINIWKNYSRSQRIQDGSKWITGFSWNNFYGETDKGDGYYLVGTSAFTGSTGVPWSFDAARKMNNGGTAPAGISGTVVAHYDDLTLSQGMEFKIWEYSDAHGLVTQYYTLNSDETTQGIAFNNGSGNVEIATVDGTKFSIYLINNNENYRIVIVDTEQSAYIFFNRTLKEYGTQKSFKMGYGDHTTVASANKANLMIYEVGVRITQQDYENGVSFAIRDKRGGSSHWYYYDHMNPSGDHGYMGSLIGRGAIASSDTYGDSNGYLSSGEYGFNFTEKGFYRFYLTNDGHVSVVQYPGEYGEGYYIVPRNSEIAGTDYYTDGIKMKDIPSGYANKAVYTCYTVKENLSIFFKAYLSGEEINTTVGGNQVYCCTLDSGSSSLATMTNGILTFDHAGSYNIYLTEDGSALNRIKCSIVEYTADNFFKLNSINKALSSQAQIKESNTSLVLEVDFTTTGSGYNVEAYVDMVPVGTGSSQYLAYTYSAITSRTEDNYSDYDNCYDYMRAKHYIGQANRNGNLAAGSHKMFILIDYKYNTLSTMPSTSTLNDFYFVIRTRQL